MSGLVYCIIHGTAWTTTNNGEVQWWASGVIIYFCNDITDSVVRINSQEVSLD